MRPRRLTVPAVIRKDFSIAVLSTGSAFASAGVLTAVTALFVANGLEYHSHALPGLIVCTVFATMLVGQLVAGAVTNAAIPLGCAGLVAGSLLLVWALTATALWALVASAVVLGLSGGLCLAHGIATTAGRVAPEHRGATSSALFAGLYLMLALPAIGVGALIQASSLRTAGVAFGAAVAVLAAAVGLAAQRRPISDTSPAHPRGRR